MEPESQDHCHSARLPLAWGLRSWHIPALSRSGSDAGTGFVPKRCPGVPSGSGVSERQPEADTCGFFSGAWNKCPIYLLVNFLEEEPCGKEVYIPLYVELSWLMKATNCIHSTVLGTPPQPRAHLTVMQPPAQGPTPSLGAWRIQGESQAHACQRQSSSLQETHSGVS